MIFGWVKQNWVAVRKALAATREALTSKIRALFGRPIDEHLIEELEEILFAADLGVGIIQDIITDIRKALR